MNESRDIIYVRGDRKETLAFDLAAPIAAGLTSAAIYVLAVFTIITGTSSLSRITGIALIVFYSAYIAKYYYNYATSRKYITDKAELTDDYFEITNGTGTVRIPLADITMTFSYSSSTTMVVIVATKDDYYTITTTCGYLLSRDKNEILPPFYAINKSFMAMNPKHVNYVRNKKYKRKMPFKVPTFVFESEYHTQRVTKFIDSLRKEYTTNLKLTGEKECLTQESELPQE